MASMNKLLSKEVSGTRDVIQKHSRAHGVPKDNREGGGEREMGMGGIVKRAPRRGPADHRSMRAPTFSAPFSNPLKVMIETIRRGVGKWVHPRSLEINKKIVGFLFFITSYEVLDSRLLRVGERAG